MRYFIVTIITLLLISCGNSIEEQKVYYHGALKNYMHNGDISAKFDLQELENVSNIVALGAAENLDGEIIILNSKPYISKVRNGELVIENSFEQKASLIVYAKQYAWRLSNIPSDVKSMQQLEKFIAKEAYQYGLNMEEPFPFFIKGTIDSLDWHVIHWDVNDSVHTHEKHQSSGLNGTIHDREVTILGFYSQHHHTIFTHHSTNMHLHFLTKDETLAGHVDDLILANGMTLYLMEKKQ